MASYLSSTMLKTFDLESLLKEILVFNLALIFELEIKVLITMAFVVVVIFVFK